MKIVIVTGLSGAGKTNAIKMLEDLEYFCMDNMIPDLIPNFINFYTQMKNTNQNVALGIDIRGGNSFANLLEIIEKTKSTSIEYEILFLECADEVLIKRYKENRRHHPLAQEGRIIDGIAEEREKLQDIKAIANYTIDTSDKSIKKLKERIMQIFSDENHKNILVNVFSFGFKYGVPTDVDYIFDVRFIPNPFYIEEMRNQTGNDQSVFDYVMNFEETKEFIKMLDNMLTYIIPFFEKEGRNQLVIGIGCTGGQHRSVTIAREITRMLYEKGIHVRLSHREIE